MKTTGLSIETSKTTESDAFIAEGVSTRNNATCRHTLKLKTFHVLKLRAQRESREDIELNVIQHLFE